jgi:purine-binding chemotaxis protein CheW
MDLVNIRKKAKKRAKGKAKKVEPEQIVSTEDAETESEVASESTTDRSVVADPKVETAPETESEPNREQQEKPAKEEPAPAETENEDVAMAFGDFQTDDVEAEEAAKQAQEEANLAAAVQKMIQEEGTEQPTSVTTAEPEITKPVETVEVPQMSVEAKQETNVSPKSEPEQFAEQFASLDAEGEAMEFLRLANSELSDQLDIELEEEELEDLVELICFELEDEEYAIQLRDVREVIKMKDITVVPKAPVYIPGIIALRGQIIPIFDLRKRVGLASKEFDRYTRIIVVINHGEKVGLIVDVITGVARINEKLIEPTPAVISGVEASFISGVGRYQKRMLIILNLHRVIDAGADSE